MSILNSLDVIKRNGQTASFDESRIKKAILNAYQAAQIAPELSKYDSVVDSALEIIADKFSDKLPHVEEIQDIVEKQLVHFDQYEVSKLYILYREKRREKREQDVQSRKLRAASGVLQVRKRNNSFEQFSADKIRNTLRRLAFDKSTDIDIERIVQELPKNIFDGISTAEIQQALILSTTALIEQDTAYHYLAARLVMQMLYRETAQKTITEKNRVSLYRETFIISIHLGIEKGIFVNKLLNFDLHKLAQALQPDRDNLFSYIGIQTLCERYFVKIAKRTIENPQAFWMRVAMGLTIGEERNNDRAIEFYELFSTMRFVSSTPTLFHSGLSHPQLSSCYLSTVEDNLGSIFKAFADNAQLSKWSGGIGNDWTAVRATGAQIESTNVESQGVIPFLKIANDTTVAINRSGKRRGATCAYLETWHLDIEDFLDLRRNTGDDRRRTHDMNTANWIPDLFMKRVRAEEKWTLFSSDEVPDLHEMYGWKFEQRYVFYENEARAGRIKKFKEVDAIKLWRKMLTRLFETGHPWITFKDACNVRSPQDHAGVIHNSNLCTEVTLNNSPTETAVCNLGSINLAQHIKNAKINFDLLHSTISTAIRMLDNVIDINYYPIEEARESNLKHRPIGLGLMGFQDVLFVQRIPFEDSRAIDFTDKIMEFISYHAIYSSSKLARERGVYKSYKGSKWDRGIFPIDTLNLLEKERDVSVTVNRDSRMDWTVVREHVRKYGMRNSNTMAIAPTATISNITGCFPCIEPIYKNLYVKANMNGEFTIVNEYLVRDLKQHGLWNEQIREQIKYYDGNIEQIEAIPKELQQLYKVSFDINPKTLITLTAIRGKWIDQSQSHNVFIKGSSGKKLHELYLYAWEMGLKTTYYLRSLAASQVEKSTLNAKQYGYTQNRTYKSKLPSTPAEQEPAQQIDINSEEEIGIKVCAVDDPDCEVCQ